MKLCKDCRHAEHVDTGFPADQGWYCRHPVAGWYRGTDVVTGEQQNIATTCKQARTIGECGFDQPKYWEAKPEIRGFT